MILQRFVTWARRQKWELLEPEVQSHAMHLLFDTIGCAIAGRSHTAARKSAEAAARLLGGCAAIGLGTGSRLTELGAILDTGAAIRALDLNDIYWGRSSGGHPSDIFATAFAMAEAADTSLEEMLTAIVVGYELYIRFIDALDFRKHFDHTTAGCMGAAAIAGCLRKLDADQFADGLAIAFASSPCLIAFRRGHVTEAKAPAPALAQISGVLAMELAQAGLSGPVEGIEADYGIPALCRDGVNLGSLVPEDGAKPRILDVAIKRYPCIGTAQTTVATAVALHRKISGRIDRIKAIHLNVQDDDVCREQIGPAYRHPVNRETADHSFWAILGMSLADGGLSPTQLAAGRWRDADIQDLLSKTSMTATLSVDEPGRLSARAAVRLDDDSMLELEVPYAPGHPRNPLSAGEFWRKFHECVDPVLGDAKADFFEAVSAQAPQHMAVRSLIRKCF
jgi:2-methylcitrate dehydratase